MNINRPRNTINKGLVEIFAYPEGDKFVGVCLTFDIVEESNTLEGVFDSVKEAALLHLKVVTEKNMSEDLLNRHAPTEYWEKYFECLREYQRPNLVRVPESAFETLPYNPDTLSLLASSVINA